MISGTPISGETISGTPGTAVVPFNGLFVSTTVGMLPGDKIQIMLDNGELYTTTIASIPAFGEINITGRLPFKASAGNIVIDLTQSKNVLPDNEDFLT